MGTNTSHQCCINTAISTCTSRVLRRRGRRRRRKTDWPTTWPQWIATRVGRQTIRWNWSIAIYPIFVDLRCKPRSCRQGQGRKAIGGQQPTQHGRHDICQHICGRRLSWGSAAAAGGTVPRGCHGVVRSPRRGVEIIQTRVDTIDETLPPSSLAGLPVAARPARGRGGRRRPTVVYMAATPVTCMPTMTRRCPFGDQHAGASLTFCSI